MDVKRVKIGIDILLTAALLLLMPYGMVGEAAHEWIGTAMFLLFVIHHILNRKWISHIRKGKYTAFRMVQTVLAFLILICILGSMVSGIILSRHVFSFIDIRGISVLAGRIHMICAYWGFVLMSLHLGIHWGMIQKMAGKLWKEPSKARTWTAKTAGAAFALYGLYAFIKKDILNYLLMQVHFVYFDYSEPVVFFVFDYLAVMSMFIFIGYYCADKGLKAIGRKTK